MTNLYEYRHPVINAELASNGIDGEPRKFPTLEAWQDVINDYEFQARCPIILKNSHKNKHFTFACHLKGCPFKILLSLCNEEVGEASGNDANDGHDHRDVSGDGVRNNREVEQLRSIEHVDVPTGVVNVHDSNDSTDKLSSKEPTSIRIDGVNNDGPKLDLPLIQHREVIFREDTTEHKQSLVGEDMKKMGGTGGESRTSDTNGDTCTHHEESITRDAKNLCKLSTELTELRGRDSFGADEVHDGKQKLLNVDGENDNLDVDAEVRELMRVHKDVSEAVAARVNSAADDLSVLHPTEQGEYLDTDTTDATVTAAIEAAVAAVQESESLLRTEENSLQNSAIEDSHRSETLSSKSINAEPRIKNIKNFSIAADRNFLHSDYTIPGGSPFQVRQVDGPFMVTKIEPYHNHSLEENLPLTKFVLTKVPKILQNELDFDVLLEDMFNRGNHTLSKFKVSQYVESSGLLKIIKDRYNLDDEIVDKKFTSLVSRKVTTYKARFVLKKKRAGDYNKLSDNGSFARDSSIVTVPDQLSPPNHKRIDDTMVVTDPAHPVELHDGDRGDTTTIHISKQGEGHSNGQHTHTDSYTNELYHNHQDHSQNEYQNIHPKTRYQMAQEGLLSHDESAPNSAPSNHKISDGQSAELHPDLHDTVNIDIIIGDTEAETDQRNVPKHTLENEHEEIDGYGSHKRYRYDYCMKDTSLDDNSLPALDDIPDDRLPHDVAEQLKLLSSHFKEVESSALQAVQNMAMEDEGDDMTESNVEQEREQEHMSEGSHGMDQTPENSAQRDEHLMADSTGDDGDGTDNSTLKESDGGNAEGDGGTATDILGHTDRLDIIVDSPESNIQPELRG